MTTCGYPVQPCDTIATTTTSSTTTTTMPDLVETGSTAVDTVAPIAGFTLGAGIMLALIARRTRRPEAAVK